MVIFVLLLVLVGYGSASDGYVLMSSHGALVDTLDDCKPASGYDFLVMQIGITNDGYTPGVDTNANRFRVTIDGIEYDPSPATWLGLEDAGYEPLPKVTLKDGGTLYAYLAYHVPSGSPSYAIRYNTYFGEDIPVTWICSPSENRLDNDTWRIN